MGRSGPGLTGGDSLRNPAPVEVRVLLPLPGLILLAHVVELSLHAVEGMSFLEFCGSLYSLVVYPLGVTATTGGGLLAESRPG